MSGATKILIVAGLLSLCSGRGEADSAFDPQISFSGFGTAGVVHSSYDQAEFIGSVIQLNGAGYDGSWSTTTDSDLGVQANITITDKLTGVIQILSRDNEDGNFKPELQWANLRYNFTPDFSVGVGRILLPTFQLSDVRNVGYSLPWVRVPVEITYANSATYADGINAQYGFQSGPVSQNLQLQAGVANANLPGVDFGTQHSRIVLFGDTLRYGDTSVHLMYQQSEPAQFPRYWLRMGDVGVTYDPGEWYVMFDSNYTSNEYFGGLFAWYLGGGVRLHNFTPYAFYANSEAQSVGSSGQLSLGNQHTVAAGARWDFVKNVDLKLQVERVVLDSLNDTVAFANIQPGAQVGDKAYVLSLTLDFVF